jgi:hypothetical protein
VQGLIDTIAKVRTVIHSLAACRMCEGKSVVVH